MLYALLAYISWGFIPAYLKLLTHLPLTQVMFHRSLWACAFFTLIIVFYKRRLSDFFKLTQSQKLYLLFASLLLGVNWAIYLYAVNTNQITEASLGYFINPLFNFLLGFLLLRERLPVLRRWAVFLAVLGVLWLTFLAGSFPWIGLSLGGTFALYGLIRKVARIDPTQALQIESLVLTFGWFFVFSFFFPVREILPLNAIDGILLIGTGIATGLPLLWFSKAVLLIPLNVLGFLQFLSPTLQFILGVYIYQEPFPPQKLIGFLFIWMGVLVLIFDILTSKRRRSRVL